MKGWSYIYIILYVYKRERDQTYWKMLTSAKSLSWKTGLLYCVLGFPECFIFRMKYVIIFYKGKKKQRWARVKRKTKQWKKAISRSENHSLFFFYRHLLQICYVTYFCARNLNEILFFRAMPVVIVPVLFNSGTLRLWLQPAEAKPSRDASFCIIQTSPSL